MQFETAEQEREYLCGLVEGERVVEEGNSGTTGWEGITVKGSRGMCVKWDNLIDDAGQMTTAVTHGTRRLRDVTCPFVQGIMAWGSNLKLTDDVAPKTEAERVCMAIERETIRELIRRLKRAKASLQVADATTESKGDE
jgi:hypothetical protein